jgi:hypothetical protein
MSESFKAKYIRIEAHEVADSKKVRVYIRHATGKLEFEMAAPVTISVAYPPSENDKQ